MKRFALPALLAPPPLPLPWTVALLLLVGYLALDWVSYILPLRGLNITPWNPAPALTLVALLRYGRAALPVLLGSQLLADYWVRETLPEPVSVVLALGTLAAYWAMRQTLYRVRGSLHIFRTPGELLSWVLVVIGGTLLLSLGFVAVLALAGQMPLAELPGGVLRRWVGDAVGILVSMPLIWLLFDAEGRRVLKDRVLSRDFPLLLGLTLAALWVAFGVGARADFKYFYVLVIPIILAATRQGLYGAVIGATLVQAGIIASVQYLGLAPVTVVEIQWLALVLASIGFFIGVVVDERERASGELRQTLRLAAAGEMAAALAHELNQPLTALSSYGAACRALIRRGAGADEVLPVVDKLVAESFRAAEIVRRLRDFFRFGTSHMEALDFAAFLAGVLAPQAERAAREGVAWQCALAASGIVLGDRVQLEIVVRNLIGNAFEALAEVAPAQRAITVRLQPDEDGLRLSIADSGPGVAPAFAERLFEPFATTKGSGMGLGLAISRSIVQAHGGRLWAEAASGGLFHLSLPLSLDTGGNE